MHEKLEAVYYFSYGRCSDVVLDNGCSLSPISTQKFQSTKEVKEASRCLNINEKK